MCECEWLSVCVWYALSFPLTPQDLSYNESPPPPFPSSLHSATPQPMFNIVLRKTSPPRSSLPPKPGPACLQINVVELEVALDCNGKPEHCARQPGGCWSTRPWVQFSPQKTPASHAQLSRAGSSSKCSSRGSEARWLDSSIAGGPPTAGL